MHRVFLHPCGFDDTVTIMGRDAAHMIKSLRMKKGERFILCDGQLNERLCEALSMSADTLTAKVIEEKKCLSEPKTRVSLFVSVPKGDKMEEIIQKAVELGVYEIHPVISKRCVSRPDERSAQKKLERWRAVSKSAAMQSDRGIIPQIFECVSFESAVKSYFDGSRIILYEVPQRSSVRIKEVSESEFSDIAVFTGPEGGYDGDEIGLAVSEGITAVTLGSRILRCESAPILALSALLLGKNDF